MKGQCQPYSYVNGSLKSSVRGSLNIKQYEVPLSRMLQDILENDHIHVVTPSIDQILHQCLTLLLSWTLLPYLTYLIVRVFKRTFATGAAWQQRTLTPSDTWSCPTLGLASVLMFRPSPPELILFLDF